MTYVMSMKEILHIHNICHVMIMSCRCHVSLMHTPSIVLPFFLQINFYSLHVNAKVTQKKWTETTGQLSIQDKLGIIHVSKE